MVCGRALALEMNVELATIERPFFPCQGNVHEGVTEIKHHRGDDVVAAWLERVACSEFG